MGKYRSAFLVLGLTAVAVGEGGVWAAQEAGRDVESVPKITLRVYNYARVPTPIWVSTKPVAARILRRAEIETEWLDCRLSAAEPRTPACERPSTRSDLILKLLPPSMAHRIVLNGDAFGIALTVDGKPAKDAIIFLPASAGHRSNRVRPRARDFGRRHGARDRSSPPWPGPSFVHGNHARQMEPG